MKLVLFQNRPRGEIAPGVLTDRGVVDIPVAVQRSYTPQLTMQGIIDDFERLRPALEKLVRETKPRRRWRSGAPAGAFAAAGQNSCLHRELLGARPARSRGRSTCS